MPKFLYPLQRRVSSNELASTFPRRMRAVAYGSEFDEHVLDAFLKEQVRDLSTDLQEQERLLETFKDQSDSTLYWTNDVEARKASFTSAPVPVGIAVGLSFSRTLITYHRAAQNGSFQATPVEVIAQIPLDVIEDIAAFRTVPSEAGRNLGDNRFLASTFNFGETSIYTSLARNHPAFYTLEPTG